MSHANPDRYQPQHHVRIVTAASLFDGHDAAINMMRRLIQASGAEVIHIGHNRSVQEIVDTAIQEDVQAVALTSYQGGHIEFFKYMYDQFKQRGANIKIFAGGGGTILPEEAEELQQYGIQRVYSPDDGRRMGLIGMINDLVQGSDFEKPRPSQEVLLEGLKRRDMASLAQLISQAEDHPDQHEALVPEIQALVAERNPPVLGITGTGGSGKSSLVDELVRRFLDDFEDKTMAVISVDPSKRKTGGALLGDRIRMNAVNDPRIFMRSLATRQSNLALSKHVQSAIDICKAAGFDLVVVETSGIGQSDTEITEHSDVSLYVMTSEYGAATQLEKIDMLDFADFIAINKFEKRGSEDAKRDVTKQYRRNHNEFEKPDAELPIFGTIASQFADPGTTRLYRAIMDRLVAQGAAHLQSHVALNAALDRKRPILPADRTRYLAEIAETCERYDREVEEQAAFASRLYQLKGAMESLEENEASKDSPLIAELQAHYDAVETKLSRENSQLIEAWPDVKARYAAAFYEFQVRDKVIKQPLFSTSISGTRVEKVSLPTYKDWGDILSWQSQENVPGEFPFTAGVFPLKRVGEDPARMFAGEGGPERTNRRFHYVSQGMPAKRLSTAFDSVTLYGQDPDPRPDIYGKVGNSGVSICNLDDAKKLYSGFDLASPSTSVSLTINGPAPMLLSFFMNAAVDQACEKHIMKEGLEAEVEAKIAKLYENRRRPRYHGELPQGNDGLGLKLLGITGDQLLPRETYERIRKDTMSQVRGTVQADILKEDQAQNTCIFSTEFALRMMGDIQAFFTEHKVRNFYSVSVSGYHIAEAGANPITQLALTMANGFTFVEYYLARGMKIDDFAPNLSFFFSNGMDPEYSVMGRVARRIWAKAMKVLYRGGERSQKLKYHIQTSGRSLHAQEIDFNDIRTTLQALYALNDNCNSLHTNAYDEAITTPTEESVRRALAIQLIINKELGLSKSENPIQGAFAIEKLTNMVEAAVLAEFRRISDRGGVLGAMERMYQRSKIQDESLHYETLKHNGELPIVGVNTFLSKEGSPTVIPGEVIRATEEEKQAAVADCQAQQELHKVAAQAALKELRRVALEHENTFACMLEASKICTLGQLSNSLYQVGGQYRRNM